MDLKLSMYILHHSSIRSVDHLGECLSKVGPGECNISLKLHRTKCGRLITNVFGPTYLQEIVNAVGRTHYSLIIDESTDVSVNKYLAICVRYFNGTSLTVTNDFLGLVEVERATAVDLHALLINFLQKIGLPLQNMIALGTDGGANLCGRNNSVFTLLQNDVPNLILLKCICHSIHLCSSKASSELPSCLDFLCREIYNWFSNSPLRKIEYRKIYDLININENRSFKNFVKLSPTRWLARFNVIDRIVDQWTELKTFFNMVGDKEKCYKAKTLADILNDNKILMYLKFLLPLLQDNYKTNLMFQSDTCDVGSAYSQYFLTIESLAQRVIKPLFLNSNSTQIMPTDSKLQVINRIKQAVENDMAYLSLDSFDEKNEFKRRCFNFLKSLLREYLERIPSNIEIFDNIKFLNPVYALNKQHNVFSLLPINKFILQNESMATIENQWRKLALVEWQYEFNNKVVPNNILQFWPGVYNYKDGSGQQIFKELATVVLRVLSLPVGNATVERCFSIMNIVKTKIRNRMKLSTLSAIIRTKIYCYNRNICCKNFVASEEMFALFNSSMYSDSGDNANANTSNNDENSEIETMLNIVTSVDE
ncbi:hypothetical protein RI129_008832 [Pyrocoelia pectoralis]|uniref:HAT C-terminal dimerisation domain-containing protein n=1 Tax=Pyrocoelia pectoralis TaxID=417401 RepID=A0AAN7ZE23_9COLE